MEKKIKLKPLDYDNLDLRNKTPYDFTDDEEILNEITPILDTLSIEELRIKGIPIFNRMEIGAQAYTWLEFANLTSDKKLYEAIEKEFEDELSWYLHCE